MLESYEKSTNKTLASVYISFLKLLLLQLLCWFDLFHGLIRFENFKLRLIRLHISHDLEIIFKNNNYELKFHSHLILPPTHHSLCIIVDAHGSFYTNNIESVTGYVMWTPYRVCVRVQLHGGTFFWLNPPPDATVVMSSTNCIATERKSFSHFAKKPNIFQMSTHGMLVWNNYSSSVEIHQDMFPYQGLLPCLCFLAINYGL